MVVVAAAAVVEVVLFWNVTYHLRSGHNFLLTLMIFKLAAAAAAANPPLI